MPIGKSGGTKRRIAVSDGGGLSVNSVSSKSEAAGAKTAAMTSASLRWSSTTGIQERNHSVLATSTDPGKGSSPKPRNATFSARTVIGVGTDIKDPPAPKTRKHER